MDKVTRALMQAQMEQIKISSKAEVVEDVLCDYAAFYRAAETATIEELKEGLGLLMDKLQEARRDIKEAEGRINRYVADLQARYQREAEEVAEKAKEETG